MKYYAIFGSLALSLLVSNCAMKEQPNPPKNQEHSNASYIENQRIIEKSKRDQEVRKFEEGIKKSREITRDFVHIEFECKKPEVTPNQCADLYIAYREKYKLTAPDMYVVSALLTRYLCEAKRYQEAIQEGRKYLDSGKADDAFTPPVLFYKAIAHYGIGERNEGSYLLQYLQEKYPLSEPAEIARKVINERRK